MRVTDGARREHKPTTALASRWQKLPWVRRRREEPFPNVCYGSLLPVPGLFPVARPTLATHNAHDWIVGPGEAHEHHAVDALA